MKHPDLADEQRYVDDAYRCLEAMRDRTARVAELDDSAAQATDWEAAQWILKRRLASLDTDVPGLSFGRLDDEDDATWYVGRRHVEDAKGNPVVVDWRADVATPFYRATAVDPMELRRRRRFVMTDRRVDDLFDEVFDDPDSVDAAHHGGIPDPLLAELERSRTGEMRDIVATIAAEQDLVIRAPLTTCMIVQGGPGTGKTAVGLHRAAFLLYEHRGQLDREGVLVIGPNPLFLRYIAQVLPSLGETAVRQTTLGRLLAGTAYRVRAADDEPAERLKGDSRLAVVLAAAVASARAPHPADQPLAVTTSWGTVRLAADDVNAAIDEIVARGVAHNVGRTALRTRLLRLVRQEVAAKRGDELAGSAALEADLRTNREWQRAVEQLWPTLSAPTVVRRLLSNARALRDAAGDVLDPAEQQLLLRRSTRKIDDEPWTEADLVLVDEAQWLIAGPPTAYGHVVVDEAQDVSALGLRALGRRCPTSSMTVLGDLAQATGAAAQRSWDEVVGHLGSPATARRFDLDVGYRVPAPIMDVANRLLAEAAPDVVPTQSVRVDGRAPEIVPVDDDEAVVDEARRRAGELADAWSSVGVIAPEPFFARLQGLAANVTVVLPDQAKGLEFDAVVVVEPAGIAHPDAGSRGLRLLYVALTRAVQELVVVHTRPLPRSLRLEPVSAPG
ncbi:MAG TPA: ATP-binding domain-containing protein [Acidimicrobiales bacterium]|jgi:DNA helicase IV|nr:ATP-binding domain-containing protein [Acidimicrobiales bacterium]